MNLSFTYNAKVLRYCDYIKVYSSKFLYINIFRPSSGWEMIMRMQLCFKRLYYIDLIIIVIVDGE